MKEARNKKKAVGTMTPFYYYDQNPQGFAFLYKLGLLITLGLQNLKKKKSWKENTKRILVVVVK